MSIKITADQIRKLREETGAPISRAKKVLEEFNGDEKKALELLRQEGFEKTAKRADRETSQGIVATYVHHSGKLGVMVELLCETDFVARNELFQQLGKDVAMQVSFSNPKDVEELLEQDFIKDSSQKISDLVKSVIAKTGENIRIGRMNRIELGK
jgi:elongation factor Ts